MYSISEVAKLTKLTARALRHYEEKGLTPGFRKDGQFYKI
jgi:DNA-binding transcriptional MerR regulator